MRSFRSGSLALLWLAIGVLAGGLLTGGAWYATSHGLASALPAGWVSRASAQAAPAPPQPRAAAGQGQATPGAGNLRKPTGEVTESAAEPASFTVRAADGTLATYRVLDTTVFMAGRDRPYRFELLKVGDRVMVREGAQGARTGIGPGTATGAGEMIARQVIVRPAGQARRANNGQQLGARNGRNNAAGQ